MSTPSHRPHLLARLWQKLRAQKSTGAETATAAAKPVRLGEQPPRKKARPEQSSGIEPLEGRIAPATLIDASTISFTDFDGDAVTIKFSKAIFNQPESQLPTLLEAVFDFESQGSGGTISSPFDASGPQQLKLMDLTKLSLLDDKSAAGGVSISITSEKSGTGDGFVTVGKINGTVVNGTTPTPSSTSSIGFGKIVVDGRLLEIDAGGKDYAYGIRSLVVQDFGPALPAGENPTVPAMTESLVYGKIGSFTVANDMQHASLQVRSHTGANGDIGTVKIGSALVSLSGAGVVSSYTNSANITAAGNIGSVTIGSGNTGDGIIGGIGANSGSIFATGSIGKLTVNGDMIGAKGSQSGSIYAGKDLGTIKITGDITVVVPDGATGGFNAGVIRTDGDAKKIEIGGNIIGTDDSTGGIDVAGVLKSVTVEGNLEGRAGSLSGFIISQKEIGSVKILGDVIGADSEESDRTGMISSAGAIGSAYIGGDLIGGAGDNSGAIHAGLAGVERGADIRSLTIDGRILGGAGDFSGAVVGEAKLGKIVVKGAGGNAAVAGGAGDFSGIIYSRGEIASVSIDGNLAGGAGADSGTVIGHGLVKKVSIAGDVLGGEGARSGGIFSFDQDFAIGGVGQLGNIAIAGKLQGGNGEHAGRIHADASIGSVKVGSIAMGEPADDGPGNAAIVAGAGSGSGRIGAITASGSVVGASIHAGFDLGALTVKGDLTDSLVTAVGQAEPKGSTDLAISKVNVSGNVSGSQFLAGYDMWGAVNGDAQIGQVNVKGNWIASIVVAGIADTLGDGFANADDAVIDSGSAGIVSRIASVIIGGSVSGTAAEGDHFGFAAEEIGTVKVNGATLSTRPVHTIATDVAIREVSPQPVIV